MMIRILSLLALAAILIETGRKDIAVQVMERLVSLAPTEPGHHLTLAALLRIIALGFVGSAPARTLMVGDSSNDAQAARAAGCPVVLVTYGYNHGEPVHGIDDDAWLDSLAHLATWMPAA